MANQYSTVTTRAQLDALKKARTARQTNGRIHWLRNAVLAHDSNKCLIWPFAKTKGYGCVRINRKCIYAHRLAFEIVHGRFPIPYGLHACDNPACFNPRHIVEGNQQDNVDDMIVKGRKAIPEYKKGEAHHRALLTTQQVLAIRRKFIPLIYTQQMLANEFGVSPHTIKRILHRRLWKHI